MEYKPDTIKVSATHEEEIFAVHADLYVVVKGEAVIGGNEALKKAKETNQLLEALSRIGIAEEATTLQGVSISASSGALLKSSSASYRLKIHCADLTKFAEILDAIAAQKNASLTRTQWKYDEDALREETLLAALKKAQSKAARAAQTLGVTLLGVYEMTENSYDDEATPAPYLMQAKALRADAALAEPSLEMDVRHSKIMRVNVDVCYRVSAFAEGE